MYFSQIQDFFPESQVQKNIVNEQRLTQNNTTQQKTNVPASEMMKSLESEITSTVENVSESIVSIVIKKDLVVYRSDPYGFFQQPAGTISRQV